jgi:hypothetical protein
MGSSGAKAQPKTVPKSFIMVTESVNVKGFLVSSLFNWHPVKISDITQNNVIKINIAIICLSKGKLLIILISVS